MCPGGNIGNEYSYFEPVHGSAPDIAGKGLANPLSQILCSSMMLHHIGEEAAGLRIEEAVRSVLERRDVRFDARGRAVPGTQAVTDAIISRLEEN